MRQRNTRVNEQASQLLSLLVECADRKELTTCTRAGCQLEADYHAVGRYRNRLREHVFTYNEVHPQAQVPLIHLLVVRERTHTAPVCVSPDLGVSKEEYRRLPREKRRKRAHPYHERVFQHQDWTLFQRYVDTARVVLVAALLGLLLWPTSLLANPFSHGYRTTPAWARDGETLCRTYNSLFQRCVVQSCDQLPVSSGRELAQRMAREIRPGNSPTASAEREWLVAEITGNCPRVQ